MTTDSLIVHSCAGSLVQDTLQLPNDTAPACVMSAAPSLCPKLFQTIRLVDHIGKTLRQILRTDFRRNQLSGTKAQYIGNATDIRGDNRYPHPQKFQQCNARCFGARQHATDIDIANDLDEAFGVRTLVDQTKVGDAVALRDL